MRNTFDGRVPGSGDGGHKLDVTLKAHKSYQLMFSFVVLLGVLVFVAVMGVVQNPSFSGIGAPELIIVAIILAFNAPQVALTLWSLFGLERITADRTGIRVERLLFGRRFSMREYQRGEISNIHFDPIGMFRLSFGSWNRPFAMGRQYGIGAGPIVFDCSGEEIRLAEGLRRDEQAARELMMSLSLALGMGLPTQARGVVVARNERPPSEEDPAPDVDSW